MNVLLLGKQHATLTNILCETGCRVIHTHEQLTEHVITTAQIDFAVSFGYRSIIGGPVLALLENRIINLHISCLPWNRGADPNLWSFLEDTAKGVTIHCIDRGIDTGPVLAQKEVFFDEKRETLRSTYAQLENEITLLFADVWPEIKTGRLHATAQPSGGSFHRLSDKTPYLPLLAEKGWDTEVSHLRGKARRQPGIKGCAE